jgi:hypothetical protein
MPRSINGDLSAAQRARQIHRLLGFIEVKEAGKNARLYAAAMHELRLFADDLERIANAPATFTDTPNPDEDTLDCFDDGEHVVEAQSHYSDTMPCEDAPMRSNRRRPRRGVR